MSGGIKNKGMFSRKAVIVILAVFFALLLAASVTVLLLLHDPNQGKYRADPSAQAFLQTAAKAALTGEEASVSQEELNGLVAYCLEQYQENNPDILCPEQIYVILGAEDQLQAYTPVTLKGIRFGVLMNLAMEFNFQSGSLTLRVLSVQIGSLKAPPAWAMKKLFEGRMPEGIWLEEDCIALSPELLSLREEESGLTFQIVSLRVENSRLFLKTTGALDEIGEKLKDGLEKWLGDSSNHLEEYVDRFTSGLKDFFGKLP